VYKRLIYQIAESNKIDSIARIESNFFLPELECSKSYQLSAHSSVLWTVSHFLLLTTITTTNRKVTTQKWRQLVYCNGFLIHCITCLYLLLYAIITCVEQKWSLSQTVCSLMCYIRWDSCIRNSQVVSLVKPKKLPPPHAGTAVVDCCDKPKMN